MSITVTLQESSSNGAKPQKVSMTLGPQNCSWEEEKEFLYMREIPLVQVQLPSGVRPSTILALQRTGVAYSPGLTVAHGPQQEALRSCRSCS